MTAITIFLLIGVAHWAAHALQCDHCRRTIAGNTVFLLDAAVHVLGWPFHFVGYLVDTFGKPRTGLTVVDVERAVNERIDTFFNSAETIKMTREPEESDEAFHERIQKTVQETIARKRAQMKEGNT